MNHNQLAIVLCALFGLTSTTEHLSAGAQAAEAPKPQEPEGVANLRQRPLRIELLTFNECKAKLPDLTFREEEERSFNFNPLPSIGAVLIPPLIEAGIGAVGSGLTYI